ncbi:hypothetical protein E8E13_009219 [Curvularia kusanoi]|uniref:Fe2OG dioxygenase domain-containing protein n=1 Tax=Curvularia kusanoi TaxID=90978 RepID=A0A9P4TMN2_CURKU|nr:hypothetical protein E8E13_009219 [Curvularia kusanoi]
MSSSDASSENSEEVYGEDERIIQELSPFLSHDLTYACGGVVLIREDANDLHATEPVVIHWDAGELIHRVKIPVPEKTAKQAWEAAMQQLIDDMQPASFGYRGKDVIDGSYRNAVKLDSSAFTTNFCPYKVGIIDTLSQSLLPIRNERYQGICADLYKLNIYEGPSGMFKAHVDTPRSETQFGSLVVCLPVYHEGGQLIVRHKGDSTIFNWANNTSNIQWAAFYGDCEHEVSQVLSGHRITLTYNLHMRRGVGRLCGSSTLSVPELPAYREMKKALSNPLFFSTGGTLGIRCSHSYAHTTEKGIRSLPTAFKGEDMVVFETARSLGLRVDIRPQLDYNAYDEELNAQHCMTHWIGKKLTEPTQTNLGGCDDDDAYDDILAEFPTEEGRIKWLWNSPYPLGPDELQFVHLRYGNEVEVSFLAKKHGYELDLPNA